MRDGLDHLAVEELGRERRVLDGARRAETSLFARKREEVLVAVRVALDPRKTAFVEATNEEPLDRGARVMPCFYEVWKYLVTRFGRSSLAVLLTTGKCMPEAFPIKSTLDSDFSTSPWIVPVAQAYFKTFPLIFYQESLKKLLRMQILL